MLDVATRSAGSVPRFRHGTSSHFGLAIALQGASRTKWKTAVAFCASMA